MQSQTTHNAHTITLDCPIDCLKAVLSGKAFNPLARAYQAPFDPPRTVGDVVELYQRSRLGNIVGLGPRRIGQIELALVLAGLAGGHGHPARCRRPPRRRTTEDDEQ